MTVSPTKIFLFTFLLSLTWASRTHEKKYVFIILDRFLLFSTMRTHAQSCIRWSKYTTHNCLEILSLVNFTSLESSTFPLTLYLSTNHISKLSKYSVTRLAYFSTIGLIFENCVFHFLFEWLANSGFLGVLFNICRTHVQNWLWASY